MLKGLLSTGPIPSSFIQVRLEIYGKENIKFESNIRPCVAKSVLETALKLIKWIGGKFRSHLKKKKKMMVKILKIALISENGFFFTKRNFTKILFLKNNNHKPSKYFTM